MSPENGKAPAGAATALELLSIAGSLSSTLDLDALLEKIGAAAEKLLDSEASSIMLVSDDKKSLFFKVAGGDAGTKLKKMTLPIGQGIAGWVAANRKPQVVNDTKKDPRFAGKFDKASGFVTRSLLCVPMVFRGDLVGVVEVLNKKAGEYTADHITLITSLANLASVVITNARLVQDQKNFLSHVLEVLVDVIETAKPRMAEHPTRSARLACALAKAMGMDDHAFRMVYYAGLLHDIGYIGLRNPRVLAKAGVAGASEDEHPVVSCRMLEGIKMLEGALPIIRHHHERHDGKGYPDGLKAAAIPPGARILALVETVEELRMSGLDGRELVEKAKKEAAEGKGSRFDPDTVDALIELLGEYSGVL